MKDSFHLLTSISLYIYKIIITAPTALLGHQQAQWWQHKLVFFLSALTIYNFQQCFIDPSPSLKTPNQLSRKPPSAFHELTPWFLNNRSSHTYKPGDFPIVASHRATCIEPAWFIMIWGAGCLQFIVPLVRVAWQEIVGMWYWCHPASKASTPLTHWTLGVVTDIFTLRSASRFYHLSKFELRHLINSRLHAILESKRNLDENMCEL